MATTVVNPPARIDPKPPDPKNGKLSFAAVLTKPKSQPRFKSIPLPSRQYGSIDGLPSISFSAAELEAGTKCYQYSLIAKFTVGRPGIGVIKQVLQENWDIKGRATLSEIWDGRHLLIILDSEEDMTVALTSPIRKVQHAMFRLFRYTAEYDPKRESTITTKWIRLPGLPPPLFHKSYIGAIANSFAKFLDIDDRTKACGTMRYARACIEVDVTEKIPEKVWVALPSNKGFWQKIIIEGKVSYCSHCSIHGHELSECRKRKPAVNHEMMKEELIKIASKGKNKTLEGQKEKAEGSKQVLPDSEHPVLLGESEVIIEDTEKLHEKSEMIEQRIEKDKELENMGDKEIEEIIDKEGETQMISELMGQQTEGDKNLKQGEMQMSQKDEVPGKKSNQEIRTTLASAKNRTEKGEEDDNGGKKNNKVPAPKQKKKERKQTGKNSSPVNNLSLNASPAIQ